MVAQFAEILKDSEYKETSMEEVYNLLEKDEKNLVASKEDGEFVELVKEAMNISPNRQR